MSARLVLLVTSVVSTGLVAGLFFGWTVSVIPGTRRIDDRSYITTMQQINRSIINPGFLSVFLATPAVLVLAGVLYLRAGQTRRAVALFGSAATYVVGVLAVTGRGNVPLNDALEGFDLARATIDDTRSRRITYETPWNQWHTLRTFAAIGSLILATVACTISETE